MPKRPVDDSALRADADGAFETVASDLPFLSPTLTSLHGTTFALQSTQVVMRPMSLGGFTTISAEYSTMCNTTDGPWSTAEVFALTCKTMGLWCP